MQKSRRARRMERHHKAQRTPALNLVSLMDIFTILVFFLLVSSSTPQELTTSDALRLPSSLSDTVPDESLVVSLTKTDILVQGVRVASIEDALKNGSEIIQTLKNELIFLAGDTIKEANAANEGGKAITVMGDETIPYELIRKILMTCQQASFTRIAFATTQRNPE